MTRAMGRSRTTTSRLVRMMATIMMVVTALAVGWLIEPSRIRADLDPGRSVIVREPAPVATTGESRIAVETTAAFDAPTSHAIIVDVDLDLDLDFSTEPLP